jgi:hypothetical protein
MTGKRKRWKRKALSPNRRKTKWEKGGEAVTDHEDLKAFLAMRDEVFANPTLENARAFWDSQKFPPPLAEDVPLGTVHKARLQWLDATDTMLAESAQWLKDHGYKGTMKEADPLTPETRDAQRALIGKPPLGKSDE